MQPCWQSRSNPTVINDRFFTNCRGITPDTFTDKLKDPNYLLIQALK